MKNRRVTIALAAAPAVVVAVAAVLVVYSRVHADLEQQRAAIDAAWSDLNEDLRERAGLIRELAAAGKGAAQTPTAVRKDVDAACAELLAGATPQACLKSNERLSTLLGQLLVQSDSRPGVNPGREFLRLEDEIKDSDQRVAEARLKYNETLEHYNARIQAFPHNLVSRIAGFRRDDAYFQTEPF